MAIKNKNIKQNKDFYLKKLSSRVKKILNSRNKLENLNALFLQIINEGNIYLIPEFYDFLALQILTNDELSTLIRITFELFTKKNIELYAADMQSRILIEDHNVLKD